MLFHITKKMVYNVPNGMLDIRRVNDSYEVWYINPIYKGSPFRCSVFFSDSFTLEQITGSREVLSFVSGITGD